MESHSRKFKCFCNMEFSGSFKVDARLMRERLTGIVAKYKQKYKDEVNVSDLSPEHTSLEEIS